MDGVKNYECTVLIDASSSANVKARSPEEAAELAENEVVERGAGSLCHQCSNHTEVGDTYAVVVYENGEEVLDTDFRSIQLKGALAREAALREELATTRSAAKEELDGVKYTRRKFRHERDSLQQRLTAADQRNAELSGLLRDTKTLLGNELSCELYHKLALHINRIDAALKPTESGASALDPKIIGIERMPPMEYDEP